MTTYRLSVSGRLDYIREYEEDGRRYEKENGYKAKCNLYETEQTNSWEGHQDCLRVLSRCYPNLTFHFYIQNDEERCVKHFKNGKMAVQFAELKWVWPHKPCDEEFK